MLKEPRSCSTFHPPGAYVSITSTASYVRSAWSKYSANRQLALVRRDKISCGRVWILAAIRIWSAVVSLYLERIHQQPYSVKCRISHLKMHTNSFLLLVLHVLLLHNIAAAGHSCFISNGDSENKNATMLPLLTVYVAASLRLPASTIASASAGWNEDLPSWGSYTCKIWGSDGCPNEC